MKFPGSVKRVDAGRGGATSPLRRDLFALGWIVGPAAAVFAWVVSDGEVPDARPPHPTIIATQPAAAASTEPALPDGSSRNPAQANLQTDHATAAMLEEFGRAFEAATDEELDLIAAALLPDIVRRNPYEASRFVELQPPSKRRDVLIRHLSRLWGESDAEGALAWSSALPDMRESSLASRAICLSLSRTNPGAAVKRCAVDDPEGDPDFQAMYQTWAESDASAAREWLAAQPESAQLERLRERYVHVLAKTNPEDAMRIAQQEFTVAADRDEAVLTVLHQWALGEPSAAREWAANRAPDHLRARALAEVEGLERYAARP